MWGSDSEISESKSQRNAATLALILYSEASHHVMKTLSCPVYRSVPGTKAYSSQPVDATVRRPSQAFSIAPPSGVSAAAHENC